jgi:hypothetical protein
MAKAFEAGRAQAMHSPTMMPAKELTVNEVEKLAKAGVTVDLDKVNIVPEQYRYFEENRTLMEPLIHRLRNAFPLNEYVQDRRFSFLSAAPLTGHQGHIAEKVGLFVVTAHGNPALLEDDMKQWPSDALMAKLHLLLETETKHKPSLSEANQLGVASAQAAPPKYAGNTPLKPASRW